MPTVYIDSASKSLKASCLHYVKAWTCAASFPSIEIDDHLKAKYCTNEEYENCHRYLFKKLVKG